jgi:leucyl aminopeptidase
VLVPAAENAISGRAFRPGDILKSRKGLTVEIGNTDAEGRLVLADALALADEEAPDLVVTMATLTGAARVALGPDLPACFTDDDEFAAALDKAASEVRDPLWRLPLWKPYDSWLASKVADVNHIASNAFAGAIVAALFLRRFVSAAKTYGHFDIFAWNPTARATGPEGGEAQAIRALFRTLARRYG